MDGRECASTTSITETVYFARSGHWGGTTYVHIRKHVSDQSTLLSAHWQDGKRFDVTDQDISEGLKWAAADL